MIGLLIASAVIQAILTILLNRTFYDCKLANLNIGIAQSVQGSMSFFVAILDYFFFG
jgi:drug/metabolite transporter (DMT)-like permease